MDYKEMYFYFFAEIEKTFNILINAQRTAEEMYLRQENIVEFNSIKKD